MKNINVWRSKLENNRLWRLATRRRGLPSLREQVASSGMEFYDCRSCVPVAGQGRIIARPQSGYYVAPHPVVGHRDGSARYSG